MTQLPNLNVQLRTSGKGETATLLAFEGGSGDSGSLNDGRERAVGHICDWARER